MVCSASTCSAVLRFRCIVCRASSRLSAPLPVIAHITPSRCAHIFPVATYIATSAVLSGLSSNFAFYLIAILNGSSLLGALGFGWVGDRLGTYRVLRRHMGLTAHLGAMNVLIQTIAIIGVVTIAWPFCSSVASLSIIGIIYGCVPQCLLRSRIVADGLLAGCVPARLAP